jgi:hypothetical protein
MASSDDRDTSELGPEKPIRRFDVFAEYTRLERLAKGDPRDVAKGYGIWLAKVVASRRGKSKDDNGSTSTTKKSGPEPKFRSLSDEEQTDRTFDHEIIDRMGEDFYAQIFSPAIQQAHQDGKAYEEIRDSIRKEWKPAP